MKVLLLRADSSGCAYHRIEQPGRAVLHAGLADVRIDTGLDVSASVVGGETRVDFVETHGASVVVFQRPTRKSLLPAIEQLKRQGVATVVEVDDLLHGVDAMNMAGSQLDPRKNPGANYRWVQEAAKVADWVTVSTPGLLREYAAHGRGSVVRNAVPRYIAELPPVYETRPDPELVTIGWTGSVGTHPWDLQEVGHGLRTALDSSARDATFRVIGQGMGAGERLNLDADPPQLGWLESVDEYLGELDTFDVGIAPLREDRFNRSKSWLKPLEYAARGIACVRSPIIEYQSLGIGYPAKRPRDWEKSLRRLIDDAPERRARARSAHELVLEKHLTEHTAHDWFTAWSRAIEVRKSR